MEMVRRSVPRRRRAATGAMVIALALAMAAPADARRRKKAKAPPPCRDAVRAALHQAAGEAAPPEPSLARRLESDGGSDARPPGDVAALRAQLPTAKRCVPPPPLWQESLLEDGFPFILGDPPAPWPDARRRQTGSTVDNAGKVLHAVLPFPRPGGLRGGLTLGVQPLEREAARDLAAGTRPFLGVRGRPDRQWLLEQRLGPGTFAISEVRSAAARDGARTLVFVEHRLREGSKDAEGLIPLDRSIVHVVDPAEPRFPLAVFHYPDPHAVTGRPLLWCIDAREAATRSCPDLLPQDPRTVHPACRATEARWLRLSERDGASAVEVRSYTCARSDGGTYAVESSRSTTPLRAP